MKWKVRRQETGRGEWSLFDPLRGYRICRYNHAHHGGTHIHHPENAKPTEPVDIGTPQEAELIMRRYHERHENFELNELQELIAQWKSESADA